jgi:hypothetical protein
MISVGIALTTACLLLTWANYINENFIWALITAILVGVNLAFTLVNIWRR